MSEINTESNTDFTESVGYNLFFAYLSVPLYMVNIGCIFLNILNTKQAKGLFHNAVGAKIVFFSYLILVGISFQAIHCIYLIHKNLFLSASKGVFVLLVLLISDLSFNLIDGFCLIFYTEDANIIQLILNTSLSFSEKISLVLFLEYYVQKNQFGRTRYNYENFCYDITFGIGNIGKKYV